MTRVSVPAMDELIDKKFPVLDDGFIRVVDYMGDDHAIVEAARVTIGEGVKVVRSDRDLIRYLFRKNELGPCEQSHVKIHVRLPMDVMRQWVRYRTAHLQEYSTRYSEAINSQHKTEPNAWRLQAKDNKQGSGGPLTEWPSEDHCIGSISYHGLPNDSTPGDLLTFREKELQEHSTRVYQERIEFGVAREQARKDLPLSTYTECFWTIDIRNGLHFLFERMTHDRPDAHAQAEISSYADILGNEIVAKWLPLTWEAFQDYRLNAMTLSGPEIKSIRDMITKSHYISSVCDNHGLGKRERAELEEKCRRLGMDP